MTPITAYQPSSIRPALPDKPPQLATQPLAFTTQRHCVNKDVRQAIIATLADKSSADHIIASIFKNAFLFGYLPELNQLIKHIEASHGAGTVVISSQVAVLLKDEDIELSRNNDNTVQLNQAVVARVWHDRRELISSSTREILSDDLARLIGSFDDEIEIGEKNQEEILRTFMGDDSSAKGLLIAAASHQQQIPYLNDVFALLRSMDVSLNLSWVDLSNLDLTGIHLNGANLSHANLYRTRLHGARLCETRLVGANMNQCDLTNANLTSACLSYARLIGAKLFRAKLAGAALTNTCLVCADMQGVEMGASLSIGEAFYNYANMKNLYCEDNLKLIRAIHQRVENDCTAHIVPITQPYDSRPEIRYFFDALHGEPVRNDIFIAENEKNILLEQGIAMQRIEGSETRAWHCSRDVVIQENPRRHLAIGATLASRGFSQKLTKLIAAYDDELEISARNTKAILKIFQFGDPSAKRLLIAAATRNRLSISVLNIVFKQFRTSQIMLDLSHVDLSDLNLSGLHLMDVNLRHANLNGASLNDALLDRADLSSARLIGATLISTRLSGTKLNNALLLCAKIEMPELDQSILHCACHFASIVRSFSLQPFTQSTIHSDTPVESYPLPGINSPVNAIIIPDTDAPLHPTRFGTAPLVITESEKRRLSANGILIDDNHDGTFCLSRAMVMYQNHERIERIDSTLQTILPQALTSLISAYDAEIDMSETNEAALLKLLKSSDPRAKEQVIAAASHQSKIAYLNRLFLKLKADHALLDLSGVNLSKLQLRGINLDDALLAGANLGDCDLSQASLQRANLIRANLDGATLVGARLNHANLRAARLMSANLTDAHIIGVRLSNALLKFANLTRADLRGGTNLQGAILDDANLDSSNFNDANLTYASLTRAKMTHTRLDRANLTKANFSHATLCQVTLIENPILTGAIWTDASFSQINADQATKRKLPIRMWMHSK